MGLIRWRHFILPELGGKGEVEVDLMEVFWVVVVLAR